MTARQGAAHHSARLTDDEVRAIRVLYANGNNTTRAIGDKFGVSQVMVWKIVNGRAWKHVE